MYASVTSLNIADLLMAIVIVTIACTGWRCGIIAEFVKLFGIFCTIFIALHYYGVLANFLRVQFFGKNVSTEFFAFSILAVLFSAIFMLISRGWVLILKFKPNAMVDHYGGLFLAVLRSYFTCGLIFFGLLLIGHSFVTPQAQRSVSGIVFRYVATNFYGTSHSALVANFFPNEAIHDAAFKVTAIKAEKKQEK